MNKIKYKSSIITILLFAISVSAQNDLGIFKNHSDIGNCKYEGSVTYNKNEQSYKISGSGKNMWANNDEFHYLWNTIEGDFILRAELKFVGEGASIKRKIGWIIKNDLNSTSQHVNAGTHGNGLTSLQFRKTDGGKTEHIVLSDLLPDVIQIERKGNVYSMSAAKFGNEFTSVQLTDMPMNHEVYVGLYVCAHNPDAIEEAIFSNVQIIQQ